MQLEECVNYLLTTAQHSVFLKMTEKLSVFDLTPVQYAVLYCLWENDKKSPKEIAERLKLENSTISGILERMEKKGLIKRMISKEDRRFIQIMLTEKGAVLEKDVLDEALVDVGIDGVARFDDFAQGHLSFDDDERAHFLLAHAEAGHHNWHDFLALGIFRAALAPKDAHEETHVAACADAGEEMADFLLEEDDEGQRAHIDDFV